MPRRFLASLLLTVLTLGGSFVRLSAVIIDKTWTGSGTDGNILSLLNWSGGLPGGLGAENFIFGTATQNTVQIDSTLLSLAGLGSALTANNVTFTDTTNYSFTGSGAPTPTFKLNGDLTTQAANTVTFASSLKIDLSSGTHTITLASGSSAQVGSAISGTGSLRKEGAGLLAINGAATYSGNTEVKAGILQVNSNGSINYPSATTFVGGVTGTTLEINGSGTVTNDYGRITVSSGTHGTVNVGSGGNWVNNTYLYVGEAGTGLLNITAGSTVSSVNTSIGNNTGGTGTATVLGTGSTLSNSSTLFVGSAGNGTLNVSSGGSIVSQDAAIGNNAGGTGLATISGSTSTWNNAGNLFVGAEGTGTLSITGFATVSSLNTTVGNNVGGTGTLNVYGDGTLNNSGALRVGDAGTGTLNIVTGGSVSSQTGIVGGTLALGASGTVNITGAGSSWSTTGNFFLGDRTSGKVTLSDGGTLSVGGVVALAENGGVGTLNIGAADTATAAGGGILDASTISVNASSVGTGTLQFNTVATAAAPYYFTRDGTSSGEAILIHNKVELVHTAGYTVLADTNDYTGNTTVNGGTLVGKGGTNPYSAFGYGVVTVASGATLGIDGAYVSNTLNLASGSRLIGNTGGGGHIVNAVIGAGVTLAPGFDHDALSGPLGSLNFGDLTLAGNGALEINVKEVDGMLTNDSVDVFNLHTLTISADAAHPFTLKLISLDSGYMPGALSGGVSVGNLESIGFLSAEGISGDFTLGSNLLLDTSAFDTGLGGASFALRRSGNSYFIDFTPVPEPSTYALMALGLGLVGVAAWRQRRA